MKRLIDFTEGDLRALIAEEVKRATAPSASALVTIPEAARLYGCTPMALYSQIHRGTLTPHRRGGKVYLTREQLGLAAAPAIAPKKTRKR